MSTVPRTKITTGRSSFPWLRYADERLLDIRLCDLGLGIAGTWLEKPIAKLYQELDSRNLRVRPHFWLSEEWFCPDGVPGIAIPFYLAHPRLTRLERKQMLEAEGSNAQWCMKILRHEAGHAVQNAFRLHRKKDWQRVFGRNTQRYPDSYKPNPSSKDYVLHLYLWYAQSHPAEDFAETFAVWLKPGSHWRRRYAGWPAMKKLQFVDGLMRGLENETPPVQNHRRVDALPQLKQTLRQYYADKQERYGKNHPKVYDRDLRRLFSDDPTHRKNQSASAFLRQNRRKIRATIAKWTGEYQFTLDEVFSEMIGRCRELNLRVVGDPAQVKLDFVVLLTVRTMQYLRSSQHVPL